MVQQLLTLVQMTVTTGVEATQAAEETTRLFGLDMQLIHDTLIMAVNVFLIFFIEMFCRPLLDYRKLVVSSLSGRSHDRVMEYVRTEPDTSSVDGVSCISLIFLGDADKHGSREQLLYWDEEIPLPALQEGQSYTVRFTGRNIIAIGQ